MNAVHSKNILIEFSRNLNLPGWLKELCYLTIRKGYLSKEDLKKVYEILVGEEKSQSEEPKDSGAEQFFLRKLVHKSGVNALADDSSIVFCPEGITLLYGVNGSGKSGYFRILNHVSGGFIPEPIYGNVFDEEKPIWVGIEYSENDGGVQTCNWHGEEYEMGIEPFTKMIMFDSNYAKNNVEQTAHDTYNLKAQGYFDIINFRNNLRRLRDRVGSLCKEKLPLLKVQELRTLNLEASFLSYIQALTSEFEEEIKALIGKKIDVIIKTVYTETGSMSFKVRLHNKYPISEILSEGERKCISLALLLAEVNLRSDTPPIILDDPVNSLDNEIIANFVKRLVKLPNQIIVFTHNYWFANMLMDAGKKVKVSSIGAPSSLQSSRKKSIVSYKVYSQRKEKGLIAEYDKMDASFHLSVAKKCLERKPFVEADASWAADHLRHAIENLIDEKVFMKLVPCRYRGCKDNRIKWTELPNLSSVSEEVVECLHDCYSRLSGGDMHIGLSSAENPLDWDELDEIYDKLINL